MATERLTNVKLYKGITLDSSNKHQLTFESLSVQNAYFAGKESLSFDGLSYQRQSMFVRIEMNSDSLLDYTYMSYTNPQYGLNKTFYAYVVGLSYQGDKTTFVHFRIDSWQTYQFDITILPSFVEREHVNNDSIGEHLLDEPVALGDYVTNRTNSVLFDEFYLVIASTINLLSSNFGDLNGGLNENVYSGYAYFITPMNSQNDAALINDLLEEVASDGRSDAIGYMYMIPKAIYPAEITELTRMASVADRFEYTLTAPNNAQLNGYSPKNNKLLTYPYRVLMISNNIGNNTTLRYEFFSGTRPQIRYKASTNVLGKITAYPINYKGMDLNIDEGIGLGDYPQCSWIKDLYSNWFAQQSIKEGYAKERTLTNFTYDRLDMAVDVAGDLTKSIATANAPGIISTAVGTPFDIGKMEINHMRAYENLILSVKEEREIHSIIPNSAQGAIGNANTNIATGNYGFILQERTITIETAKVIDDFFDMNGYRINRVKIPNITGRRFWNFVKTNGFNCKGNIPNDHKLNISNMFDRGVTFWHGDYIGEYNRNNTIGTTPPIEPSVFRLDVIDGTGGGTYTPGQLITVTANTMPTPFLRWVYGSGSFADDTVTPGIFTMPSNNVVVTAKFQSDTVRTIADAMGQYVGAIEWDSTVGAIQTWFYGRYVKAAWCATSMSYFANQLGLIPDKFKKHENVDSMFNALSAMTPGNAWYTSNYGGTDIMPVRGDAIFFSAGYTTTDLTHVGVVSGVSGTSINYYSGNTSNPVSGNPDGIFEKTLAITNRYVVCFFHIDY